VERNNFAVSNKKTGIMCDEIVGHILFRGFMKNTSFLAITLIAFVSTMHATKSQAKYEKVHVSQEFADTKFLADAVDAGDIDTVRSALARGVAVDSLAAFDVTALQTAALRGRTIIEGLTESGSIERREAILMVLLDAKANPKTANVYGGRPLSFAVTSGTEKMVRALITAKADPNEVDYRDMGPLHIAAEKGNLPMVQLLFELGVAKETVNSESYDGTPLKIAYRKKHADVATVLRQHGAIEPNPCSIQ
jgi:ankyrin repeat protein